MTDEDLDTEQLTNFLKKLDVRDWVVLLFMLLLLIMLINHNMMIDQCNAYWVTYIDKTYSNLTTFLR